MLVAKVFRTRYIVACFATVAFSSLLANSVRYDIETYWSGKENKPDGVALEAAFLKATPEVRVEFLMSTSSILTAMATGYELKLFEFLETEPKSFAQIKLALNISERTTEALLVTLVGANMIDQDALDGKLKLASKKLHAPYLRAYCLLFKYVLQRQFFYYTESTLTNAPVGLRRVAGTQVHDLYALRASDSALQSIWDPVMDYVNGILEVDLQIIFDRLGERIHVLDVCGNEGTNAMRIARAHPLTKFVMADLPGQVKVAKGHFEEEGLDQRIDTIAVDWLASADQPFGEHTFDAVYMLHAVSIFDYRTLEFIFQTVIDALRPGGIFMFDTVTVLPKYQFRRNYINMMDVYFVASATPTHRAKYFDEIHPLLQKVGFQSIQLAVNGKVVSRDDPILANVDSFLWRQLYVVATK